MSEVLDGIGLVSGVLGIISFFQSGFPADAAPQGATVLVKAGLNQGDDDASPGGAISGIYGFDANNNYLGVSGSGDTGGDGGIFQTVIDQSTPGVESAYVSVSNADDATCVAWITVKQYDGTPDGSWTGDVGYSCGANWYYGVETAGYYKDTTDEYKPYCTWLDGNHDNDITNAAMKFRVRAYGQSAADTVSNNQQCTATIFGPDTGPINGAPSKRSSAKARAQWMEDTLITSTWNTHTAAHLCAHPNSYGPDFVGSDGMFCDMGSKTVTPLCETEDVDGCVEVDAEGMKIRKRTSVARRTVSTEHKVYKKISRWV